VAHGFGGYEYDARPRDGAECSGGIPVHDDMQKTIVNNLSEVPAEASTPISQKKGTA
jgi:hypothetical protein